MLGTPGGASFGLEGFILRSVIESAVRRGFGAMALLFGPFNLSLSSSMVLRAVRDFALCMFSTVGGVMCLESPGLCFVNSFL